MKCTVVDLAKQIKEVQDKYVGIKGVDVSTKVNLSGLGTMTKIGSAYNDAVKTMNTPTMKTDVKSINSESFYEGDIVELKNNEVFVFGSNGISYNGNPAKNTGGSALFANKKKWVGQKEDMANKYSKTGKSYGLQTVAKLKDPLSKEEITSNIKKLYNEAKNNPDKTFYIAYRNTKNKSLNGYSGYDMIDMFNDAGDIPSNIVFSSEWKKKEETTEKNENTGSGEQKIDFSKPIIDRTSKDDTSLGHTGGAYGNDTEWDIQGRKYNVKFNHYKAKSRGKYPETVSKRLKDKGIKAVVITQEELDRGYEMLEEVYQSRYPKNGINDLKARNYVQVVNSDAVFAIVPEVYEKYGQVPGGTNAAILFAKQMGKPVYAFSIEKNKWFTIKDKKFVETETPTLTKNFAAIGTRNTENYNVKNKETGKWESREDYLGKEAEDKAIKAIQDVYAKTFKEVDNTSSSEQIEIDSYQDGLEYALTNPTHTTPTGYNRSPNGYKNKEGKFTKWSKAQTWWRSHLGKNTIDYKGKKYLDVEQAYQANKKKDDSDYKLMVDLLEIKLNTFPILMQGINLKGGLDYLGKIVHNPTTKTDNRWQSNNDNLFAKALTDAYKKASVNYKEPVLSKFEKLLLENAIIHREYETKQKKLNEKTKPKTKPKIVKPKPKPKSKPVSKPKSNGTLKKGDKLKLKDANASTDLAKQARYEVLDVDSDGMMTLQNTVNGNTLKKKHSQDRFELDIGEVKKDTGSKELSVKEMKANIISKGEALLIVLSDASKKIGSHPEFTEKIEILEKMIGVINKAEDSDFKDGYDPAIRYLDQLNIEVKSEIAKYDKKESDKQQESEFEEIDSNEEMFKNIFIHLKTLYPNISTKKVNNLVDEYGKKILGQAFESGIEYSNNASMDTIPHEYAHIYINMLKNTQLIDNAIKYIVKYKKLSKEDAKEYLVQMMGEDFAKKHGATKIEKNLIQRIWKMIKDFFNKVPEKRQERITEYVKTISNNFFIGENQEAIRFTPKEEYSKMNAETVFKKHKTGVNVLNKMQLEIFPGSILTGSLALSTQVNVYRKGKGDLHDIDMLMPKVPNNNFNIHRRKFIAEFTNAYQAYNFSGKIVDFEDNAVYTPITTYIVPPVGTFIFGVKKENGEFGKVIEYKIMHDKTRKIIGTYSAKTKINKHGGSYISSENFGTGEKAIIVDLMFTKNDQPDRKSFKYKSKELGRDVDMADSVGIFDAKKVIGDMDSPRDKDIMDYNMQNKDLESKDKNSIYSATKKSFNVNARILTKQEKIETVIDGKIETTKTGERGDYVLTGPKGEEYTVDPANVNKRYIVSRKDGNKVVLKTKPSKIKYKISDKNFKFTASWGENMIAEPGDALVYEDGKLSYRIEKEIFNKTYDTSQSMDLNKENQKLLNNVLKLDSKEC